MITLTNLQARQFLLLKHGLIDDYKFTGKQGVLDFVRQAGCIQFDPLDICGKNAELVCQSRVEGFTKEMLYSLLYEDRMLIDYVDKNLAILPIEDWSYFERYREAARREENNYPEMFAFKEQVYANIEANGAICSNDIALHGDFFWRSAVHWSSGNNLSRSVLEQMYSAGELIIHHKKGTRKYYDIAEKHIPRALLHPPDPLPSDPVHFAWRVLRRIGAVGLLWNRPSDAWLNIWGLKAQQRNDAFEQLLNDGRIIEAAVDGVKDRLYFRSDDLPIMERVLCNPGLKPRCELIAPLDNLLWDRRLIIALFGFDYTWEVYTPVAKRKYGHYVLPLLYGDTFIGRVEASANYKTKELVIKNIWLEKGVKHTKKLQSAINRRFEKFARFNGCDAVIYSRKKDV